MAKPAKRFSTKPVYIKLIHPLDRDANILSLLEDNNFLRVGTNRGKSQDLCSYQIQPNDLYKYEILDDSGEELRNVSLT